MGAIIAPLLLLLLGFGAALALSTHRTASNVVITSVTWTGPRVAISGHVTKPSMGESVLIDLNDVVIKKAYVYPDGGFFVGMEGPRQRLNIVTEEVLEHPLPTTQWADPAPRDPPESESSTAQTATPLGKMWRRVAIDLRYNDPSITVVLNIPRTDDLLRQYLSGLMPATRFIHIAMSGMNINGIAVADAVSSIPAQLKIDNDRVVIEARSTSQSIDASRLALFLPTIKDRITVRVDPFISELQRSRYRIHDDVTLTMIDFALVEANLPSYTIDHQTGHVLRWIDPFTGPGPRVEAEYPFLASPVTLLQLASNTPSAYSPQRLGLLDQLLTALLFLAPIFAFAVLRRKVSILGPTLFSGLIISAPLVGVLLLFEWPGTFSWYDGGALVALTSTVVLTVVAVKLRRMLVARLLAVLLGGIATALAFDYGILRLALAIEYYYDVNGIVPVALAAMASGLWSAGAAIAFDCTAGRRILTGGLRPWFIIAAAACLAIPWSKHSAELWYIAWSRVDVASSLFRDLVNIASSLVFWAFGVSVCIRIAKARVARKETATSEGRYFVVWYCSGYLSTIFTLPLGLLFAALLFGSRLWRERASRESIDVARETVLTERRLVMNEAREDRMKLRLRGVTDALEKLYRSQKITLQQWLERRRDAESILLQPARKYYGKTALELALAYGPERSDRANAWRAVKIGLLFSFVDALLGIRDAIGAVSPLIWDYAFFSNVVGLLSSVLGFVVPSFTFGYYFRYLRGSTGLQKGLLMGTVVTVMLSVGWLMRTPPPILLVIWCAEWILLFATIGTVFDAMTLRQTYSGRYRLTDIAELNGLPGFAALVTLFVTAVGGGVSEAIKGEFVSMAAAAAVAAGVTNTHPH